MALKLKGSTSGFTAIDAPAVAGDNTLVLPADNGSASQYLQTNGSGVLSWATVATPTVAFESYAVICDQKPQGTVAGAFTSGDWRTRDLNTEIFDPDGIVSISNNQFTLGAGNYYIEWSCPAYAVNRHQSRLQDITGTATIVNGTSEYTNQTCAGFTRSFGFARVSITSNNVYEIQHQAQTTKVTNGLGSEANFTVEIYTVVKIFKEA